MKKKLKIYAMANEMAVDSDPSEIRVPFSSWPFGIKEMEGPDGKPRKASVG